MKKILIISESNVSKFEKELKLFDDIELTYRKPEDYIDTDSAKVCLTIIEIEEEFAKNLVQRNKFDSPVLILNDRICSDLTVRSIAYDYIIVPAREGEFELRAKNLIKIKELKEEVKIVSTTDELTGLYNRTYLHQRLEEELSRAKRYDISVTCLLFDIDFFKVINDMYGYDWGDKLLIKIAEIMKTHIRKEDILTRYGDEEYMLILPNTDEQNAHILADRIRKDVADMQFIPEGEDERHPVSISCGISSFPFSVEVADSTHTLIRYAEHALYNAKKKGKNRVVKFSQINMDF
ncbi:MAG: GGDEF domain-containing protein [bacterium]